ncbi:MAG: fumarylacetoacetate hydrolase family protein [Chloroflexi bacterium]|nr:fumarylacetoacetate hydrolase family protein [Chloroflexota bacterium]
MKIVRFKYQDAFSYGTLESDLVTVYDGSPFPLQGVQSAVFQSTQQKIPLKDIKLLAPCQTSKVVCLGLNYRPHAAELNIKLPDLPLLFIKPSTSVIGPGDNIVLPPNPERIDYEGELGVVIGRAARNVAEADYDDYVLGYTCFNDVTDRVAQVRDGQWTRAKGYDTFAPTGPCISTGISPFNLKLETLVNGEVKQSGNTADLIFGIPRLVSFISGIMTLLPGDIIATGTPDGIGPLKAGDTVEIVIEGIGTLRNSVVAA